MRNASAATVRRPSSRRGRVWRALGLRRWSGLLALCSLLFLWSGLAVGAEAEVRTGTTELLPPSPPAAVHPADAPDSGDRELHLPPVPPGYGVHDAGWLRVAYPPGTGERIQPLIDAAGAFRAELARRFAHPVLERVDVRVARTPAEMARLAPEGAPFPAYASGVAYSRLGLVLLSIEPRFPNQHHDLREIFRHELAHLAIHEAAGGAPVPLWFNEGFAVHVSGEASLVRLQTLWTATLADRLLPLATVDRRFPAEATVTDVAYAQAADVVRFLIRRQDEARFAALFARVRGGQPFDAAMTDAYGVDRDSLEAEWREDVTKRYTFWPILLSGGVVWVLAIALAGVAWRRRRRRDRLTLQRWAREEATEEGRRQALEAARREETAESRRHGVLAQEPARAPPKGSIPPPAMIPKVEHGGRWHTLH